MHKHQFGIAKDGCKDCFDCVVSERDALKAEVKEAKEAYNEASVIAKKWIERGDSAEKDSDHWKQLAEGLAERLRLTDDALDLILDGSSQERYHKRNKVVLDSYDAAIREKAQ